MSKTLVAWIGRTDLRAAQGDENDGDGPIAQALTHGIFARAHLISNFDKKESQIYGDWLKQRFQIDLQISQTPPFRANKL
jgi:hypothetical protein